MSLLFLTVLRWQEECRHLLDAVPKAQELMRWQKPWGLHLKTKYKNNMMSKTKIPLFEFQGTGSLPPLPTQTSPFLLGLAELQPGMSQSSTASPLSCRVSPPGWLLTARCCLKRAKRGITWASTARVSVCLWIWSEHQSIFLKKNCLGKGENKEQKTGGPWLITTTVPKI